MPINHHALFSKPYIKSIFQQMDKVESQEFMRLADLDGDGNVNYEEFVTMLFKSTNKEAQSSAPHKMCLKPMDSNMVWRIIISNKFLLFSTSNLITALFFEEYE